MSKFTNTGTGARGINVKIDKDGGPASTTWIDPGETVEIDDALVSDKALHEDIKKGDAAAKKASDDAAAAAEAAKNPQT